MKTKPSLLQPLRSLFARRGASVHKAAPLAIAAEKAGSIARPSKPERSRASSFSAALPFTPLSPTYQPATPPVPMAAAESKVYVRLRHYVSLSSADGLMLAHADLERRNVTFGLMVPLERAFAQWQSDGRAETYATYECVRDVAIRTAHERASRASAPDEVSTYADYDRAVLHLSMTAQLMQVLETSRFIVASCRDEIDALMAIDELCRSAMAQIDPSEVGSQRQLAAVQVNALAVRHIG